MPMRLSSDQLWHRFARRENRWTGHWREIDTALKFAVAAAVASFCAPPLIVPVLSMVLVTFGFWTAGSALLRGEHRQNNSHYSRWDEAGLLVFVGFGAAILSEPVEALRYLELVEMRR